MPERTRVNDSNVQRAQLSEQPQSVTQGDTFGSSQSSVFGNTKAPSGINDALQAIGKFGKQVGLQQLKKEAQADFVSGQALRAAGEELTGKERPPSRQGFKALDAKLKTQAWHMAQKLAIDNGENDIDPVDYSKTLGDKFQTLLTGDAETDAMLTASMGQLSGDLGRYHAAANTKKRTADGITQATADVRDHIIAIQQSKDSGDTDGESAARASLESALSLPTVTKPEVRQKLASDLSIMALELGDPSVLNYVRANDIALTPQQERAVMAAKASFNKGEGRKLDKKYQDSTADFEAAGLNAKSTEEFRELRDAYADQFPGKVTDKYLIAQESAFRKQLAKGATQKLGTDAYNSGLIGQWNGTPKQVQATIAASKAAILGDPALDPDDAQTMVINNWKKNGVKDDALAKELQAGLSVPLLDGVLHPNFQPAFDKLNAHYKAAPDLALSQLSEQQRNLFLNVKTATESGGQTIGDAVSTIEANRVNAKELTRDEKADYTEALNDATDTVLGKGFFNWEHGVTTSLNNTAEIKTRLTNLADLYMAQGMTDPVAAVESARMEILSTHEQLGDALVFNDGKPFNERMGISADRTEDAMDYMYENLTLQDPSIVREDTVLLGNPKDNTLLIGVKNEFGVLTRTIPADMKSVGTNFNLDVVQAEHQAYLDQETASIQNTEDKMALRQEAIDSKIYNADTADAAFGNIIGSNVLEQRVKSYREDKADSDTKEKYGIESDEELEQFKIVQSAFAPGNPLTEEQSKLLQDGDTEGYLRTIGGTSGQGADTTMIDHLATFESTTAHKSVEGGADTRAYGLKSLTAEEETAITGKSDKAAAQTVLDMRASKLEANVVGYAGAPKEVKNMLLDIKFNTGTLYAGQKAALKSGDYMKAAKETLDVTLSGDAQLPGLAKRRAVMYNKVAALKSKPKIASIVSTATEVKYLDADNNVIETVKGKLHSKAKAGTITL